MTDKPVIFNGPWPDEQRCQVNMIHQGMAAQLEFRCVLIRDHYVIDEDSDHIDEHGCHAQVLVSQATIREVEAWSKIPMPGDE